jgi:uncharacterized protein YggT (Ycf19 family)
MNLIRTLYVLKDSFIMGCRIFQALLSLRLTFMWFPNFNAYQQPLYFLTQITDPYFGLFGDIIPTIFQLDFSFTIAMTAFELFIKVILTRL